jgi:hypothetical protein
MKVYKGGCHCGRISFEVEGDIQGVMECNCSICTKRGYLLWFVPRAELQLSTPESNLSTYTFNTHTIKHRFCSVCGCAPFGEGANPKTKEMTAAVNVRCLEDVDLQQLKKTPFDGRSL